MGAETAGFKAFSIEEKEIYAEEDQEHSKKELLQRAVHELAIKRIVPSGANLVLLYSCFNPTVIDSISLVTLDEHQEKLDWQKLRKLDTNISPKTIRTVVELAMSIGREGREGKKVGTMFVVGDTKRVMKNSRPIGSTLFAVTRAESETSPVRRFARSKRSPSLTERLSSPATVWFVPPAG